MEACAKHIYDEVNEVWTEQNILISCGGGTPKPFYSLLFSKANKSRRTLLLSDERIVPDNHPKSNRLMISSIMQKNGNKEDVRLLPQFNSDDTSMDITQELNNTDYYQNASVICAILGIGEDGHTASIFPGANIDYDTKEAFLTCNNDAESFGRLSLSFTYLFRSEMIMLYVTGNNKLPILRRVLNGSYEPQSYPVQYILRNYNGPLSLVTDLSMQDLKK